MDTLNGSLLIGMNRRAEHVVVCVLRIVIVIDVCCLRAIGGVELMIVGIWVIILVEKL